MTLPKIGATAPAFTLTDQDGKTQKLSDYKGKWALLYFYPKDNTPGCTIEAQILRDHFAKLKKRNCAVLGVSKDSEASHKRFCEKQNLPFPLLADTERVAIEKYGVWQQKKMAGRKSTWVRQSGGLSQEVASNSVSDSETESQQPEQHRYGVVRMSFLIDPNGKIAKVYEKVKPAEHAAEVLEDLKVLQK